MKKLLAIFMAIAMVATMFSFSVVAFAEDETETVKASKNLFIGTSALKNYGVDRNGNIDTAQGASVSKAWNLHVFNPETTYVVKNEEKVLGTTVIDLVNDLAASGEYSQLVIKSTAGASEAVKFIGIKGTEETPVVIVSQEADKEIPQLVTFANNVTEAPAITLEDCEYVTVKSMKVSALNNGIVIKGCSNVKIENVEFSQIGYIDYLTPVVDEEGNESINAMDTTDILEKGSSVLVGTDCENVTVSSCSFTKCRAGVVADSTNLEEGEEASTGIEVLNCTFEDMTDAAVVVNGADDVVVSGGTVENSGSLAKAADYDGTVAADFIVCDAENVTIEKIYSTDNNSFIYAENATGRVRYNVSDRDGYSYVDAEGLLIYNNTFVSATSLDLTATVKNNIFSMLIGEKVTVSDGAANCYHWTSKGDRKSIKKNPWFANAYTGAEEGVTVRDNYILAVGSPCLGAGVQVEEDMGTTDFYGNEIGSSHNIGADQGAGVEASRKLVSQFSDSFNYIIALIRNFFANLFG